LSSFLVYGFGKGAGPTKIFHEMNRLLRAWCFVVPVGVILLAGCSDGPPASTQNPPAYPGVTAVEERALGPEDNILGIFRSVSFTTTDAPEKVLAFYREKLEADGWRTEKFQPIPEALMFRWESYEDPPTVHWCEVVAARGNDGITNVRVELRDGVEN
jgi:hypothetical protein